MSQKFPANNDHSELSCSTDNSIFDDDNASVTPRRGRLVALRTKAEVEHDALQTVPAYIVEIPQKSANRVLK